VAGAVRIFVAGASAVIVARLVPLLAADGHVTLAAGDRAARNGREQPWRP